MFGYWVISPEGTRPKEYRDENMPIAGEPDIMVGAKGVAALQKKSLEARARFEGKTLETESGNTQKELSSALQDDNMEILNEKYEAGEIKSYKDSVEAE